MDRSPTSTSFQAAGCPVRHAAPERLEAGDVLVLEAPKRMVLQYVASEQGATELVLFYGDKEVSFDEPHLFAFGETLARQTEFVAGSAVSWGKGLDWAEVRDCLLSLLDAGIIMRAEEATSRPSPAMDRYRASPLPPAQADAPSSWVDLEAISARLTGRAVEHGWLELVIPVFRVAHIAIDADDRQVGEANVFPRALRLDRPTEWMACTYQGTRYLDPRPMNVTALKSMRSHWTEMMLALAAIRDAYLTRYPGLSAPLSIGAIERLATLVLAVSTYQLVKGRDPVPNGALHPALSSLFRVTDGLRVVMHQMLFVPVGEPTLPPDTPMSVDRILDYAERSFAFHSETGVCAGPRHFVRAFLEVLVDGRRPEAPDDFTFSPPVASALGEIEQAFDYGLEALRAHAALFSFWPKMARCYEQMAQVIADAGPQTAGLVELNGRLQDHLVTAEHSTYLGSETWRTDREAVYADMFDACSDGLSDNQVDFLSALSSARLPEDGAVETDLAHALCGSRLELAANPQVAAGLAGALASCARDTQALIAVAAQCQVRINSLLGRPAPQRPFSAQDINVHVLLQGERPGKRLPFLFDEVKTLFGITLEIDAHHIRSSVAGETPAN